MKRRKAVYRDIRTGRFTKEHKGKYVKKFFVVREVPDTIKVKVLVKKKKKVRVKYYDDDDKLTTWLPNKHMRADIYYGQKKVFSKRGYFDTDISVDAEGIIRTAIFVTPIKIKGEVSFRLKASDIMWEQLPEKRLINKLKRYATSDRIRVYIRAKMKGETLSWTHEYIVPISGLRITGRKKAIKIMRDTAAFQIKRSIFDAVITDITKSGYRMSSKKKIDTMQIATDLKKARKELPLLRYVDVTVSYE